MVFAGAKRSSSVGVHDLTDPAIPVLRRPLPSGIGPDRYTVNEEHGPLVFANETDDAGHRADGMVAAAQDAPAVHP
ncbi:MAG: hypothetical protein ACOCYW_02680 [Roseicyclus sp.]